MMLKEDAQAAVEEDLRTLMLTKPMDFSEKLSFCQEAYKYYQFRSSADRLQVIRGWVEEWERKRIWAA